MWVIQIKMETDYGLIFGHEGPQGASDNAANN